MTEQEYLDLLLDKLGGMPGKRSDGAKIIFPFARSIIASVTQNGGSIPIVLDNPDFNLLNH